jgi:hypothetical protein
MNPPSKLSRRASVIWFRCCALESRLCADNQTTHVQESLCRFQIKDLVDVDDFVDDVKDETSWMVDWDKKESDDAEGAPAEDVSKKDA